MKKEIHYVLNHNLNAKSKIPGKEVMITSEKPDAGNHP